jgi:hypothetical protein
MLSAAVFQPLPIGKGNSKHFLISPEAQGTWTQEARVGFGKELCRRLVHPFSMAARLSGWLVECQSG